MTSSIGMLQLVRYDEEIKDEKLFSQSSNTEQISYEKDIYLHALRDEGNQREEYDYEVAYLNQIRNCDLNSLSAYAFSDMYLQRLEKCNTDIKAMIALHIEMSINYCKQVRGAKLEKSKSSYVIIARIILRHI